MKVSKRNRQRGSIRLAGYDYTQPGGYYVTIITLDRLCLFGEVVEAKMHLNVLGKVAYLEWFKTSELRPYVELRPEEFMVMPNHIHGIIWIRDRVGAEPRSAPTQGFSVSADSLGAIIRAYKSAVTYAIHTFRGSLGEPVWQRNYYEHILRGQADWEHACDYIQSNPRCWEEDEENPGRVVAAERRTAGTTGEKS